MSLVCSCGASLPDDARFCHRCGKPQREEMAEPRPEPTPVIVAAPIAAKAAAPLEVTFSNPLALRTSLLVASLTTILEMIPFVNFIAPIVGGFASASLYQRRSGQTLTPRAGAKLGWITAILNALLLTVFLSLDFAVAGSALLDLVRENVRQQASSPAQLEALRMMGDTRMVALMVLIIWVVMFTLSSLLSMAGGALAARMYRAKTS